MKKILLFACAAVVALASCSKDPDKAQNNVSTGELVDFVLGVGADSRYEMEVGGLGNVDKEEYSMRYILEVYTEADEELYGRYERYSDIGESVTNTQFTLRLPLNEYQFVMWADFVAKVDASGEGVDEAVDAENAADWLYYTQDGLRKVYSDYDLYMDDNVDVYPVEDGGRMLRDAYCASQSVSLFESVAGTMLLRRPFVRVEIWSDNMRPEDLAFNGLETPKYVMVQYQDVYWQYDVYAQDVVGGVFNDVFYAEVTEPVGEAAPYRQLLAFDYVFVPAPRIEPGNPDPVKATISYEALVADETQNEINLPLEIKVEERPVTRSTRSYVHGEFFGPTSTPPDPEP